jgi:hypothetical protein
MGTPLTDIALDGRDCEYYQPPEFIGPMALLRVAVGDVSGSEDVL